MSIVSNNGQRAANDAQHLNSPNGHIFTVADVALKLELTEQSNGKFCGAPDGTGKTKDGFVLCPDGNAFTNGDGPNYNWEQVAALAGISPDQYAPIVDFRAGKSAPAQSRSTQSKATPQPAKSPAKTFLDWESAATTIYSYQNEIGETLFEVARAGRGSAKQISQRKPNGRGGFLHKLGDVRRVLYRLPEVLKAQFVFICEGEFAAESLNIALKAAGLFGEYVATTAPHGAGKWKDEFAEILVGKTVIVLPDNDDKGASHADAVCASCRKAGAIVKRVELPELPEKGDVADFLSYGGTVEKLLELFKAAPTWTPATNHTIVLESAPDPDQKSQLTPEQIRAAFKATCSESAPVTLAELVVLYRKWMFVKDDGLIKVALATFAANLCDGDPVWLMIVGGSSSGKTETINPLSALPYGRLVGTLTESSFLSGSPKRDKAKDASGGLLREMGAFGVMLFKDFTSILSLHHDKRISVLAALREIYDGSWTRDIGTDGGRKLEWRGKMGIIACCTDAIESAHAVSGSMGERFMRYRLQHDDDDQRAMTRQALRRVGRDAQMRTELEEAVTGFFGALQIESAPEELTEAEEDRLIGIAMLTAKSRSVVDRDAKTRDIELTHDAEIPVRLASMLRRVLHGLRVIGVPNAEAWTIIQKIALDSIPKLRAEIIRLVAHEIGGDSYEPLTAKRIEKALKTSAQSTRRALEELRAHCILDSDDVTVGSHKVADWKFSELGAALWNEGFSPFPVKSVTTNTPTNSNTNGTQPHNDLYKSPLTISTDLTGNGGIVPKVAPQCANVPDDFDPFDDVDMEEIE